MDPRKRDAIVFGVAIAIVLSQTVVAVLGRSPSELMIGTALLMLGIPVATNLDDRRNR